MKIPAAKPSCLAERRECITDLRLAGAALASGAASPPDVHGIGRPTPHRSPLSPSCQRDEVAPAHRLRLGEAACPPSAGPGLTRLRALRAFPSAPGPPRPGPGRGQADHFPAGLRSIARAGRGLRPTSLA